MTLSHIKTRWRKFKTALVVVLITFLIWYAADLDVSETREFSMTIRLTSSDPDRYAGLAVLAERPDRPTKRSVDVRVTLKGRRRRLADFKALVDEMGVVTVDIDRSQPTSPEPKELSTIDDVLNRITELRESRLNVVDAIPRTLTARIDEVETKTLPVKADFGDLEVTVSTISPQKVSVRMPRFVREKLGDEPVVLGNAEQIIRDAVDPAEGDSFEADVPLTMNMIKTLGLESDIVKFQPSSVTVKGRIKATPRVTKSKGPIQVKWYVPTGVQKEYVVETDQDLRMNIDVKGPENRIDQLDAKDIRAWVEVFAGDVDDPGPGKEIIRRVEFRLPPAFSDCTPVLDPPPEIRFRLEPSAGNSAASTQG